MPYRFLEETATADVAFEVDACSLEELFKLAADAVINVMIESLETIRDCQTRRFELENPELDLLLFDFLQELIYYKDAEQLLLRCLEIRIDQRDSVYRASGLLSGEFLDPARHEQRVDVKAVTLHQFQLQRRDNRWWAHVILDI